MWALVLLVESLYVAFAQCASGGEQCIAGLALAVLVCGSFADPFDLHNTELCYAVYQNFVMRSIYKTGCLRVLRLPFIAAEGCYAHVGRWASKPT